MRFCALLATLLIVSTGFAHDLYLMPARFVVTEHAVITVGLQNGDSFPESDVSPVLERVRDMRLISATRAWEMENLHVAGKSVQGEIRIPQAGSFVLTARTIPHAFLLGATEFNAYLKEEGLDHVLAWRQQHSETESAGRERYAKFAKALLTTGGNNSFHTAPVGLAMEIVPETSPYDLKDTNLPIRILLDGKPLEDVQVETAWVNAGKPAKIVVVGRTDADGHLVIPGVSSGKWRIHSVFMERCKDQNVAEWESKWASLTFQLP